MKHWYWVGSALVALVFPMVAWGATFFAHEEVVTDSVVRDDVYSAGTTVRINHEIQGDLVAVGSRVEVTAPVWDDVFVAGDEVDIHSVVGDDLHVAGSRVAVAGEIADDLFVVGESVDLGITTAVAGDAYIAARRATIRGAFRGSLRLASEDASIQAGTIIHGDLVTVGQQPRIAEGVEVKGAVRHTAVDTSKPRPNPVARWVLGVVTWFVVGYLLVRLFSGYSAQVLATLGRSPLHCGVVGLLWTLLWLPAALFFAVMIVGLPISLMIVLGTVMLYVAAIAYAVVGLGVWVIDTIGGARSISASQERAGLPDDSGGTSGHTTTSALEQAAPRSRISWQHVLLGAVLYKSVLLVPIGGWIATAVLVVVMSGALLKTTWGYARDSNPA